ncbi:zinc finger protein 862-like [Rana temporaria]|uniref:zinc finger protein 862-like n=1 Tax=Rana temporaria TaxID=8407 RepID=UPI001AAC48AA|nr:zinc finger protein 862-like [Rana temporaria]
MEEEMIIKSKKEESAHYANAKKMKRAAKAVTPEDAKQPRMTNFFAKNSCSEGAVQNVTAESNGTSEEPPAETSPSTSHPQNERRRKFKQDWCKLLTWLKFDHSTGIAICEICSSFPGIVDHASKIVKGFSGPFKLETFKKHGQSLQHNKCIKAKHALLAAEATPLPACVKKMDQGVFNHMKVLFNVAYYIAKHNKPYTDFKGLLELTEKLGVAAREEYANDKRCKEFISHIATVIRKELICELKKAKYVSLMLDESTNKGGVEELILYVRYIKNNGIKEVFLSVLPLEMATADGYLEAITKELKTHGLSDWLFSNKLIGIGTDGAASMIGAEDGLVQKVRRNLSHVIGIHCVAHRLNLSVLSSVKEGKCIDDLDSVLKKLYQFYQQSPKRMRQLKQVAESFHEKIQNFQYLHNIRWVSSKVGALSALVKDWKCVTVHLESVAAEKDSASAVARGLLKKLTDFKFVHMLHFLLDYLEIIKNLSLLFQREELFLSTIELHVKNTICSLKSLKDVPKQHEERFLTGASLKGQYQDVQLHGLGNTATSLIQNEKEKMIQHGAKYLEERFLIQRNIERSTAVFDTFAWPSGKALQDYGVDDITALAQHFQKQLSAPEMHEKSMHAIHNEWYEFKVLGKGKKLCELLDLSLSNTDRFPVLGNLLSIVSVLPVSTACCERGFSLMNLVKNKFRSLMQQESLGDLLMTNMNGPSVKDFDPVKAIDHWYSNCKRTRHIHGHKKPSEKKMTLH